MAIAASNLVSRNAEVGGSARPIKGTTLSSRTERKETNASHCQICSGDALLYLVAWRSVLLYCNDDVLTGQGGDFELSTREAPT